VSEHPFALSPKLAVGAVIRDTGRVLLVRRGNAPSRGLWAVPGGRVEPGETLEAAVRREVLEETGLAVEVDGLLGVAEREDPAAGVRWIITEFAAHVAGSGDREPRAGDDAAEAAWFDESTLTDRTDVVRGVLAFLAAHPG
jgi:ADP-ribose pyrophosphatase YjhB (NUDIX family)